MSAVYVDARAAAEHVESISAARTGSLSLPTVDVGDGDATATLARLSAGVAGFPMILRLQLTLATVALGSVVADAEAADRSGFVVS